MKTSVTSVALSALFLTLASVGVGWNVHAGQLKQPPAKVRSAAPAPVTTQTNMADADLMATLGDEVVSSCNVQHKNCSKVWHELNAIAAKEKL